MITYVLVRSRSAALKSAILVVILIPLFSGDIVRSYGWLVVRGRYGVINAGLGAVGIAPPELLHIPTGVLIALVQFSLPVMVLILIYLRMLVVLVGITSFTAGENLALPPKGGA